VISENFLKTIAQEYHVSNAELEVLSLAMQGESTAAIATQLSISADAVRKRLSEMYQKFQISGRGPVKLNKLQQLLLKKFQEKPMSQEMNRQPRIDWANAPDVSVFYDRTEELRILSHWLLEEKCRLVAVLGIGGMGKTVLTVKLAQQIQEQFDFLVWRSLYHAPPLPQLLDNLIATLSQTQALPILKSVEEKISWLIAHLRSSRCLIILDGVESILGDRQLAGVYQPGYEIYDQFFKRIAEEPSRSCLILTSREKNWGDFLIRRQPLPSSFLAIGRTG
jgi:DNA-binding CsgD family transcriptional regulator